MIVSYAMDRVTSSLEVQCLNEDCGWKGKLGAAGDHNRLCPRQAKISCPLGCNEKLLCWTLWFGKRIKMFPLPSIIYPSNEKLDFVLFYCRSQFVFHLSSCPCRIVTCKIKGCNLMF
ncbi:unnamed protein product [Pocillopora meandrina]|uniref:Uncharacterized protein n=1 Tax=Pocillopora meandrina TaxID=46732 RepID=A0AAU9X1E8_9CNID|nr:unnamed protein product [Pocillopora meandrina]